MRRAAAVITTCVLTAALAACGGGNGQGAGASTTTTTDPDFLPAYTNKCEEESSALMSIMLMDKTVEPAVTRWGAGSPLIAPFTAVYEELRPAFDAGAIGVGIRYLADYSINICRDNDLYNAVLGLGEGDEGWRDGCLDGKMPDVNETLTDCTEGSQATATTSTTIG